MADAIRRIRSSSNNKAEGFISFNNISKIIYRYVYLRRIGSAYDALLCRDENSDCDSLVIHGVSIGFESVSRSELGDEVVINGRSVIYHEWDPCRSRRYLMIIAGGDANG
jgi:hypothetical protein